MKMLIAIALAACAGVQAADIKVNQVGFNPQSSKLALLPPGAASFALVDGAGKTVFQGAAGPAALWPSAAEKVRVADFSHFAVPGTYRIKAGSASSDPFVIKAGAYAALNAASIKAFYFNRSGIALDPAHAGEFARPAGHPDTTVLVHASAASGARPEGTVIASPKGWYDAGDYNKYIVNSGISTYTLLAAFEHFPAYFKNQRVGIPESGQGLPDILAEAKWNLDWMLTMQDPADGGVYHKLTNKRFDGMVMPDQAMKEPRYVVKKGTAAALNFAATMAAASRVYAPYDKALSARMLAAAQSAWKWAEAHPAVAYRNPPDVATGEYGDAKLADEFAWAAAELYITTANDQYYRAFKADTVEASVPNWAQVNGLAWMSLAHHAARLTPVADRKLIAARIEGLASGLAASWQASAYRVAMQEKDFVWGSNAVVLNQAMMLLQGYRLNRKPVYLQAAQSGLDYVLGRNALGISFVTGFGTRSTQFPHHRPSDADKVAAPVPGFLAGGPQAGQQDKKDCKRPYPSALPALSYLDDVCSYASNEVAINWNAPLVYVSAALDVLGAKETNVVQSFTLEELARQEQELQFTRFDNDTALEIGSRLIATARARRQAVSVNITRNGEMLYFHAMTGTSADNADWIRRKNNLVNRTGHSSYYIHTKVKERGGDIDAMPAFDQRDFAAHGGAFPVLLKGTGMIGTITVSGLPGVEDHALVVEVLRTYLNEAS